MTQIYHFIVQKDMLTIVKSNEILYFRGGASVSCCIRIVAVELRVVVGHPNRKTVPTSMSRLLPKNPVTFRVNVRK